jgi:hypothetical protein
VEKDDGREEGMKPKCKAIAHIYCECSQRYLRDKAASAEILPQIYKDIRDQEEADDESFRKNLRRDKYGD